LKLNNLLKIAEIYDVKYQDVKLVVKQVITQSIHFILFYFFKIYLFEREPARACMQRGGAEGERERIPSRLPAELEPPAEIDPTTPRP